MKIKLLFLLFIFFTFSCKNNSEIKAESSNNTEIETLDSKNVDGFNFNKFKIDKGNIGPIKIGMKIFDAEKEITELTKKECEAYDFGYDGGGKAYIYYLKDEPILALVPKMDSDEILVIIALSKNLKTNNGLNPNSTVKEIQEKYPNIEINQDLMMSWEFMHDENNNWNLVFMTEDNNRIGDYKELEVPTKPIRNEIAMNWITIK
ncbi:hypothetical protein FEDK69T_30340 [Flavobacterium enshiense DK69]|uniref:Lipoprotein n=1 Tax=Flavobacterium enshiense DK69 TaxID=1107311 RepID=V6S0J9_9FLAO|nr:hypothetical protein [Flavobacterium enshiense]ESU20183.1 hypothetical protein FEDK69T_30340 [Flavobacterium enshiense DK69]KGO92605.1 hypothetical protein Q767_15530 [Flavobacterium enshiense DK69]